MTAAAIAEKERTAGSYRTDRNDVRSLAQLGARILRLGGLMLINFDADMQDDLAQP